MIELDGVFFPAVPISAVIASVRKQGFMVWGYCPAKKAKSYSGEVQVVQ